MSGTVPNSALSAWHAYTAMRSTKSRHVALLTELEARYDDIRFASAGERARLEQLLTAHDAQVKAFKRETVALKERDPDAHAAFIAHLAHVGSAGASKS